MNLVRLGSTGLFVSRLCLGTMTFGAQCDRTVSFEILDKAAEAGINFLDTADVYPTGGEHLPGETERILGEWLGSRRDQFVIGTKAGYRVGPAPWDEGSSRKHLMDALDASLRRLRIDYVDIYQLHKPDPLTPIDETLAALDDMVRTGKVRYIGCSNFFAYEIARALGVSALRGWERFATVQPRYNLLFREPERELLPLCQQEGLAVLPYNPLAGGLLTGKYRPQTEPVPTTRFSLETAKDLYRDRYWHKPMFDAVNAVSHVAEQEGIPSAQLAMAWVLAKPAVTSAIVGVSKPAQLDTAVAAASHQLSEATVTKLDELTAQFRRGDSDH